MRLQGVWLLRGGRRVGVGVVAERVGVHERTVPRWRRWYEAGGLDGVRAQRHGGVGQPPRLSAAQQEHVAEAVATGRFRTAAEVGAWIAATFGASYRPGGLSSLLGRRRCAPKVPRPIHEQADLAAQDRFKKGGARTRWRQPAGRAAGAWAALMRCASGCTASSAGCGVGAG